MNYLAHLFLSGNNENIMIGNFIADHIKGNQVNNFQDEIIKGIQIHRKIDSYTDQHDVTAVSKERLRPYVGKYAPVALDIIFDHYLSVNWETYHNENLSDYLKKAYAILDSAVHLMPERTKYMYSYMRRDNWLGGYRFTEGIQRSLTGLSRRAKFENDLPKGYDCMMDHYAAFNEDFNQFFPDLIAMTKTF